MAGQMWDIAATPMGRAITEGNFEEMKRLLKTKEVVQFKDRKGNTYLHYACTVYRRHTVNILLASSININHQNKHGNTALHVSAMQSECCHVADLMMSGINPHLKNWEGKTAAELTHKNKFWLTIYNKYMPDIFDAVRNHDTDSIPRLLQHWIKADCVRDGQTVRQYAAVLKFHDIVCLLDEQKPTSDLIHGVLEINHKKVVDALNKSKCNVNYMNQAVGRSHILQYAIDMRDKKIVDLLCDAGSDVNTLVNIQNYYKGPLYYEAFSPNVPEDIMWKILRSGADFKLKDERGRNALIYAVDKSRGKIHLPVVDFIIKNGGYIGDRDETGVNIRDVARFARRKDIVDYIDKYYVKILRRSDIEMLMKLTVDGYDSLMIEHNSRDTFIFASGNETDDVLKFIEQLPKLENDIKCLHKAIKNNESLLAVKEIFDRCDKKDALVNAKDKGGRTSVILSVLFERLDILEYLLQEQNVDINRQDNSCRTAYHYACCLGKTGGMIRKLLKDKNIDTHILDNLKRRGEEYLQKDEKQWIKERRMKVYGMEVELLCMDTYEELRSIIESKDCGLEKFNERLKHLHLPVASFAPILCPVVPDYHDLIFIAVDQDKPDIVRWLADLGTELSRKEMYKIVGEGEEEEERWMTVDERAEHINLPDLAKQLKIKRLKQETGKITLHCKDSRKLVSKLAKKLESMDLKPLLIT